MVLDLKFTRFEDQPWGFRLTGGSDFELPLTVIKVTKGSIAESFGMKVGDVIVRINETPMSNLNHNEAHEVIMKCGNNFIMGVLRPDEEGSGASTEDGESEKYQQIQTPDSQAYSDMSEMTIETNRTESRSEKSKSADITDDHIAELMSGEAEVLKEHNVIGVNFKKIMPKAGLFKSSEVFKHLNAEAVKTKEEKENETKRWTTFLQKPDRPIPKSKAQLEDERKAQLRYQIKICKQPKPRCAPNRTPTPPREPEPEPEPVPNEEPVIELVPGPEPQYVEYLSEPDIFVANDQALVNADPTETGNTENINKDIQIDNENTPVNENPLGVEVATIIKTEEELLIEKQLADVQKQLLALSTLPSTIQATLDAVTKQLAELMPALKQQQQQISETIEKVPINLQDIAEAATEVDTAAQEQQQLIPSETASAKNDSEDQLNIDMNESIQPTDEMELETIDHKDDVEEIIEEKTHEYDEEDDGLKAQEDVDKQRMEKVYRKQEEEWLNKREKEKKRLEAEAQEMRLAASRFPRRLSKSQGGPLTPQERPLVLPGGRKWRNERDAFNEDFIAEIISSQAELIMGSTLGNTFESPLLGYDERETNCPLVESKFQNRVNFLKYKKPEKDLSNLNRSEVFKIIHHIEREPKHGIQVRPPKVMAEEDVRNRATPISISCV